MMMASAGRDRGSPGLRYWLRTGLPVWASIAATSMKSSAAGVATTWTVQPCSWASWTSWPTSAAGPAPHAMTSACGRAGSCGGPDPAGEVLGVALDAERGRGHQVADQAVSRGAAGDLLGRDFLGRAQGQVCPFMPATLQECAGGVHQEARLALGDVDLAQFHCARDVDRGSGVAEGDGDVDPVQADVGGAEGRPAQVAVCAQAAGGFPGFGQQFVGSAAVVVLGGCYRSAQQKRP